MNDAYHIDDSIAAPATARGRGAVAVIRTSGSECVEMVARVFSRPDVLLKSKGYRVHYGWINDFSGKPVDEVLVTVFRAPASYTGEDSVEISCHGGPAVVDRILQVLKDAGFRSASPGEFTFRAFSNGKMDLTRAEAVREIIDSRTEKARALALSRLSGAVSAVIDEAKDAVRHQAAAAALALDYAEDETEDVPLEAEGIQKASLSLKALIGTWHTGRLFRDGLRVTLAGPANAGKSSLFNLFLREERSIVAEVPGTTRDWVEAWLNLDGIPLLLADTAGLRSDVSDQVEEEGIRRTRRLIEASDIVLLVADGSGSLTQLALLEQEGLRLAEGKLLRVWNKADLGSTPPEGWIPVSALKGQGFKALEKAVRDMALSGESMPDDGAPVIDSMRQKNLLEQAAAAMDRFAEGVGRVSPDLLAEDLRDALDALGELTGEVTREDILETLFSEFCVGK